MMRTLLFVCFFVSIGSTVVQAQSLDQLRGSAGAFYTFAEETDITIEVKVWGAVGNPGLYEVRQGLDLSTLLTLAGGPQAAIRQSSQKSTFSIRLFRTQPEGYPQLLYETRMENEVLVLDQDPVLMHGDILIAEEVTKQRFSWRDGISVLTAVGTAVLLLERVVNIGGN